jgi:hypothetical protein
MRPVPKPVKRLKKRRTRKAGRSSIRKITIKVLDKLAGALCRSRGKCQAAGSRKGDCKGPIQWCHIVSRRYLSTRWDMDNCLAMCAACHMFYTYHPVEWENLIVYMFGAEQLERLKYSALKPKPNYDEILAYLKRYEAQQLDRTPGRT